MKGTVSLSRLRKEEVVEQLRQRLQHTEFLLVTDFRGMNVGEMSELRRRLRDVSAEYRVVKNTLLQLAIQGTAMEDLQPSLVGPTALAISSGDPVSLAKALWGFQREREVPRIKAAFLEGRTLEPTEVERLVQLPGRAALLAQLLGVLEAPQAALVRVLAGLPLKLVRVLEAIRGVKEAKGD